MAHEFSRTDFSSVSWADTTALPESWARRGLRFLLVAGAHVAVIGGAMELASRPAVQHAVEQLYVRLVELPAPAPAPPVVQEVKPPPKKTMLRQPLPLPAPSMLTAAPATDIPSVADFVVTPQPPAPPSLPPIQVAPPEPPAPAPVIAARFDADYLHNPKPVYPPAARRLSEEGVVHLRVQVSASGATLAVEVRQSSGYPRLDAAALGAVRRWRFVPARQGADAIESWVTVPIAFKLES